MNAAGRVRIKICGMTRLADALCAVEAGVDGLGFIFSAKSPRMIALEAARAIIAQLPPLVDAVGVFVDEQPDRVAAIVRECGIGIVQLHGAESPAYCRELATLAAPCKLLKAIRIGGHTTAAEVAPYNDAVHGLLLDTYQKNVVGGTGQTFDWALIDRLDLARPFLLAGGLDADNIDEALARVRPYGVDANSGLEDAPGQKNHGLIRRFVAAVRAFETRCLASQQ
ncbi:MAG: phosphoribosylanthranilate isomerase [Desulfobulbus sp.]|jgi:phosphoribosylanthranilate isomerase|uniref:phosphoribosylanthranilate isomerase n=1 Tax=Desulfobulbus sp. TaxID=895 RepID=UPI00284749FB|nr:phosphoribosylanthranilate isomerase [Desulfobulbus sp.]MDR2549101.1 phosphoribosylanthranilate isomerase [Desulfobulbus sp.]